MYDEKTGELWEFKRSAIKYRLLWATKQRRLKSFRVFVFPHNSSTSLFFLGAAAVAGNNN